MVEPSTLSASAVPLELGFLEFSVRMSAEIVKGELMILSDVFCKSV